MSPESRDLTIETALSDPIIQAAMKADRVNLRDFETLLRATAHRLEAPAQRRWTVLSNARWSKGTCGADRGACFA